MATQRQNQRLLNVARALRESPEPKAFSMDHYINDTGNTEELNWCGTPACALGHYVYRRDLQRLARVVSSTTGNGCTCSMCAGGDSIYYKMVYGNNRSCEFNDNKILEHFGITDAQADELFGGEGCGNATTPLQAARYIEKFVANRS